MRNGAASVDHAFSVSGSCLNLGTTNSVTAIFAALFCGGFGSGNMIGFEADL